MIFACIHTPARPNGTPADPVVLVISAPSWIDAKSYALRHFAPCEWKNHEDPASGAMGVGLIVKETGEDAVADIELRWIGSQYGEKPDRRLEMRKKLKKGWGEWKAA